MLEEVCPIEVDQAVVIIREVGRHPVQNHTNALLMQVIDEIHQILGRPVTAGGRKVADSLVTIL
jgi:hypothetical protein